MTENDDADEPQLADRAALDELSSRFDCGWWRHMNASISSRPARSAASNARSTSAG